MSTSRAPWTVHEKRCMDIFGPQNRLPKEGSLQRGEEYRWLKTRSGWGPDDTQMLFPHKQMLLPPGSEDLLDSKTCEAFNAFIRQTSPDKLYGTLPLSLPDDQRCPGVDASRSWQEPRRCLKLLQSWSQVLMVQCPEGYTPYCLEHESVAAHKQRLATQDAEFAKFRNPQQHQGASSAAGTSAAFSPAAVPSSVASEADSKKRPNSSEQTAPLRKPQRSSRRRRKSSTKPSQSEQDQPSVTALAHQFAAEISQAVSPASTSQAFVAEPATPFDPQVPHHDEGFTSHDEPFMSIPSSAESNDSSDGNYGQYLDAQDLDSPFYSNAFAQFDEGASLGPLPNDWEDHYETQSQYSDCMHTHQQANPSL